MEGVVWLHETMCSYLLLEMLNLGILFKYEVKNDSYNSLQLNCNDVQHCRKKYLWSQLPIIVELNSQYHHLYLYCIVPLVPCISDNDHQLSEQY